MYAASPVTPRSRLGGTRTVKPRPCKSDVTAFQLAPSAQAPWTRTIVGSVIVSPLAEAPAARCGTGYAHSPHRRRTFTTRSADGAGSVERGPEAARPGPG